MENTENMIANEVVDVAAEEAAVIASTKKQVHKGIAIAAVCILAYPVYKFVAKPLYLKFKEKKAAKQQIVISEDDSEELEEVDD